MPILQATYIIKNHQNHKNETKSRLLAIIPLRFARGISQAFGWG
jgi:hypothetical protein